jgi:hypothetical protein
METKGERRRHKRIPVIVETEVHILHPEDTLSRTPFQARISNITEKEARVALFDLSIRHYQKLIKDKRLQFARMFCSFPTSPDDRCCLYGRIVYFDYHGKNEKNICEIAVQFCENEDSEMLKLRQFLRHLKRPEA